MRVSSFISTLLHVLKWIGSHIPKGNGGNPPAPESIPYSTTVDPNWLPSVQGWTWRNEDGDEWWKVGACPTCNHQMDVSYLACNGKSSGAGTTVVVTMEQPELPKMLAGENGIENGLPAAYASCNCTSPHDGRPAAASGCGQQGFIPPPTLPPAVETRQR